MTEPPLFPDATMLAAIARRFGLAATDVLPLPGGEANHVFLLGDALVLRVPRNEPNRFADLRKETEVIPMARAANVLTPALIAADDGTTVGVPFMVLVRAAGVDLERLPSGRCDPDPIYHEVGQHLARLHLTTRLAMAAGSTIPTDDGDRADPLPLLERLVLDSALDAATADWLGQWFKSLAVLRPVDPPRVLIHGDVAPRNLLADPGTGQMTAVIDWGDAAWADPAMDLAKLPLERLTPALTGYLAAQGARGDELRVWQARVLHYHLHWAVAAIARPDPATGQPRPHGAAFTRLMGVLRFLIDAPDDAWRPMRSGPR